jgi:uridine kinase
LSWQVIAIDGPGGSGKSTLANQLAEDLGAVVIPMDAFLLPAEKHRISVIAKNYDLDRFYDQVISELVLGQSFSYGHQDLTTGKLEKKTITAGQRVIVDGIYSLEVRFRSVYDLSIYLDIEKDVLLERGMTESDQGSWLDKWLAGEETYLEAQNPILAATLVLDSSKPFPSSKQVIELCELKLQSQI